MKVRHTLALALLLAAAPALAQQDPMGMGGNTPPPKSGNQEDILPDVDEEIASDAQKVFDRAEQDFAKEDWLEAIAHYQHLRAKFSFNVPLTTKAELRLGDIAFAREHWSEARGYYRNFLRFHPKHEQADYAAFRAGLCTYREIPSDSWLFPPSAEKDQSEARAALAAMSEFLRTYPTSKYADEARAIIAKCEAKLAEHELYVAKFYAKRHKWKGTLLRVDGLLKSYPTSPQAAEALTLAVEGHAALGQGDEARQAFDQLAAMKPEGKLLDRGQAAVAKVK